jgi:hypothetical protein
MPTKREVLARARRRIDRRRRSKLSLLTTPTDERQLLLPQVLDVNRTDLRLQTPISSLLQ